MRPLLDGAHGAGMPMLLERIRGRRRWRSPVRGWRARRRQHVPVPGKSAAQTAQRKAAAAPRGGASICGWAAFGGAGAVFYLDRWFPISRSGADIASIVQIAAFDLGDAVRAGFCSCGRPIGGAPPAMPDYGWW